MPKNPVSTGILLSISNSVESPTGSSSTPSEGYAAGSARPPQDIECVQEEPVPEPEREDTDKDATESRAEDLDPVNMATGEYICEDKDFTLPD
ncbi:MAG: hypothetical protein K2I03_12530, partial [Lachnospiraceae bacterium]|nr:hypothetical protein [Lachnospiraceae bacterium]